MHSMRKLLRVSVLFIFLFALLTIQAYAAAEVKVGTVKADALRLRKEPDLSATILTNAYEDDFVVVLEKTNDTWSKVNYKGTTGYMSSEFITIVDEADFDPLPGSVSGTNVNIRAAASISSERLGLVGTKDTLSVTGVENGWFKVNYQDKTGYIHPDYLQLDVKTEVVAEVAAPLVAAAAPASDAQLGAQIVEYAKAYLGTPYKYGSMSGKSFDCSGFTSYVFKHFGVSLNRSAAGQLSNGAAVEKADLQAGDIVIFSDKAINKAAASHVGIYIGNGEFIHASSRRSGGVVISNLSDSYYNRVYKTARRVI